MGVTAKEIQEGFDKYTGAVGKILGKLGTSLDEKQKKLIQAYKDWAEKQNNTAVLAKEATIKEFGTWVKDDLSAAAAKEGMTQTQIDGAIKAVKDDADVKKAYDDFVKTGKYAASGAGDFLGKNWPMLAAIVAPLMLGNFFELGAVVPLLLGAVGLGAAAYFSKDGSMLKQGTDFIQKQFSGPDKGPKKGASPAAGAAPTTETPPKDKIEEYTVTRPHSGGTAVEFNDIIINGEKRDVLLLGDDSGKFTRIAVYDNKGCDSGFPIEVITLKEPINTKIDGDKVCLNTEDIKTKLLTAISDKAAQKAKAEKELLAGEFIVKTSPSTFADAGSLEIRVSGKSDPDVTRLFEGTLDNNDLKITVVPMGPNIIGTVSEPIIFKNVAAGGVLKEELLMAAQATDGTKFKDFVAKYASLKEPTRERYIPGEQGPPTFTPTEITPSEEIDRS